MADLTAPPRDPAVAGCVGKPQQQIAVACQRRAEADEVMAAQFAHVASMLHGAADDLCEPLKTKAESFATRCNWNP
jgi:hypothetical protein